MAALRKRDCKPEMCAPPRTTLPTSSILPSLTGGACEPGRGAERRRALTHTGKGGWRGAAEMRPDQTEWGSEAAAPTRAGGRMAPVVQHAAEQRYRLQRPGWPLAGSICCSLKRKSRTWAPAMAHQRPAGQAAKAIGTLCAALIIIFSPGSCCYYSITSISCSCSQAMDCDRETSCGALQG